MDTMNVVESSFRWVHVVAGVLWIGLLYFFNWVNSAFAPTLDAESKKKVIPELLPRTLFWFRWGAAYTWISGLFLLALVYYHGKAVLEDPVTGSFTTMTWVGLAIALLGVFAYDILVKTALSSPQAAFFGGWILASVYYYFARDIADMSYRGAAIHTGALFGTCMAFNVWYRIWPAQQKIITAIKNGQAPDGDLVKLAGTRSKHNTYMSVPLIFTMISQHATWAASQIWGLPLIILIGFVAVYALYEKAKKVPGF